MSAAGVVAIAGTAVALGGTATAVTNAGAASKPTDYLAAVTTVPHTAQAFAVGEVSEVTKTAYVQSDLIERWTGSKWELMKAPASVQQQNGLSGVWAASKKDVFAVGSSGPRAQVLHWAGAGWKVVNVPGLPASASLSAISGSSSSNVWAVGAAYSGSSVGPLEAHFNGSKWTVFQEGGGGISFQSVAVVSAKKAWAVGSTGNGKTVVDRYNGTSWKQVRLPKVGAPVFLDAVSAKGAQAWFVGSELTGKKALPVPLALHWNGSWHVMKPPKPTTGKYPGLDSVLDLGTVVWAIGTASSTTSITPFTERFVSGKWKVGYLPQPKAGTSLSGLAGDATDNVWTVGTYPTGKICNSPYEPVSFHHKGSWKKYSMPGGKVAAGASSSVVPKVPSC